MIATVSDDANPLIPHELMLTFDSSTDGFHALSSDQGPVVPPRLN